MAWAAEKLFYVIQNYWNTYKKVSISISAFVSSSEEKIHINPNSRWGLLVTVWVIWWKMKSIFICYLNIWVYGRNRIFNALQREFVFGKYVISLY